jgi:hypothetical protein
MRRPDLPRVMRSAVQLDCGSIAVRGAVRLRLLKERADMRARRIGL